MLRILISTLVALINSLAIVTLGVLSYIVLNERNKTLALVALGCFLAKAITLVVSKIGAYVLKPLSQEGYPNEIGTYRRGAPVRR